MRGAAFLEEEQASIGEPGIGRSICVDFEDVVDSLFTWEQIQAARRDDLQPLSWTRRDSNPRIRRRLRGHLRPRTPRDFRCLFSRNGMSLAVNRGNTNSGASSKRHERHDWLWTIPR